MDTTSEIRRRIHAGDLDDLERRSALIDLIAQDTRERYGVVLDSLAAYDNHELELLANPELVAQLRAGLAEARAGNTSTLDLDALEASIED